MVQTNVHVAMFSLKANDHYKWKAICMQVLLFLPTYK